MASFHSMPRIDFQIVSFDHILDESTSTYNQARGSDERDHGGIFLASGKWHAFSGASYLKIVAARRRG
jgi:hypothetical protein|tara:strand:+ start:254 stop:457 length:204 start_codon:yes stop_codon:yes gene_type:complete